MPIPYPEAFRSGRQEGREELAKKRLLSLQVVMLDWFCLGSPSVAPHSLRLGAKLTAKQWTAVEIIRHLGWDDNTPQFIEAEGMGRGAAKFEGYEDAINALHRALAFTEGRQSHYFGVYGTKPESVYPPASLSCGTVVGALPKVTVSPAKAIEADRIELPAPPAFNPVPLLDDATREVYESPLKTGVAKEDLGHSPVVHIRATKENKLELLKKLCQTGRLKPLHWSSVRKEHLSGLFAVPKSLTRDRLILDARPANQADTALNCWCKTMASAAILVDVVLTDEQVLVASGEDLRDFFYQFAVSQERTTRNALADPLSLQEALYVFGKDAIPADWTAPIFCGLSTLAMGDQNACEFAQCSHLSMMLRAGVLTEQEMLTLQGDIPRGILGVGVIIDDLVLLEKLLWSKLGDQHQVTARTLADDRLDLALKAYAEHKLEVLKKFGGPEIVEHLSAAEAEDLHRMQVILEEDVKELEDHLNLPEYEPDDTQMADDGSWLQCCCEDGQGHAALYWVDAHSGQVQLTQPNRGEIIDLSRMSAIIRERWAVGAVDLYRLESMELQSRIDASPRNAAQEAVAAEARPFELMPEAPDMDETSKNLPWKCIQRSCWMQILLWCFTMVVILVDSDYHASRLAPADSYDRSLVKLVSVSQWPHRAFRPSALSCNPYAKKLLLSDQFEIYSAELNLEGSIEALGYQQSLLLRT
eukprot:g3395.t1